MTVLVASAEKNSDVSDVDECKHLILSSADRRCVTKRIEENNDVMADVHECKHS
jgi:hypothetical protein